MKDLKELRDSEYVRKVEKFRRLTDNYVYKSFYYIKKSFIHVDKFLDQTNQKLKQRNHF